MRTLGNIIWHFPYFGFIQSICYALGGLFWCLTIIGIPLGMGLFQLSLFMLAPFNQGLVSKSDLELLTGEKQDTFMKGWAIIIRILYFPFGLMMAFGTIFIIAAQFVTLIGIPCGLVEAKAFSTIFNPINKKCVPRAVAEEIERRKASNTLNKYTKGQNVQTSVQVSTTATQAAETNTQQQVASDAVTDEYLRKAEAKTDDELKVLLQNKDDYNPQLIKAAEKVLLERITGGGKPKVTVSETVVTVTASGDDRYKAYQPSASGEEKSESSVTNRKDDSFNLVKEEWNSETKESTQSLASSATNETTATVAPSSNANNTVLFSILGGVALAIIAALTYFLWYVPYATDRDAPRTYVVANNVFLRSSRMAGIEYNILGKIPYGSEVITYSKLGDWAEVKVNGQEGFISSTYLIDSQNFNYLNDIWGDLDTKECIESAKCRLAILDYFKKNQLTSGANGWQVFTRPLNQKPNTVFYPRLYDKYSKFTDFVFIAKDNTTGNRVLVCYSFEDSTEEPIFRFSMGAPQEGYIKNVVLRSRGVRVIYDNNGYQDLPL